MPYSWDSFRRFIQVIIDSIVYYYYYLFVIHSWWWLLHSMLLSEKQCLGPPQWVGLSEQLQYRLGIEFFLYIIIYITPAIVFGHVAFLLSPIKWKKQQVFTWLRCSSVWWLWYEDTMPHRKTQYVHPCNKLKHSFHVIFMSLRWENETSVSYFEIYDVDGFGCVTNLSLIQISS